jgi:putative transposase
MFMPSGLERFHHSGQSHFVTFTCYHRFPHLAEDKTRKAFVAALERARKIYHFRVYGFVAMPEHAHLLISEPERGTIATAVQALKISSSLRSATARNGSEYTSPLWQKRYYDRNIRDYAEFVEKLQYIHRNPVKRGLVERAEEWNWGSFRHYALHEECGVEIESQWTADKRNSAGSKYLQSHIRQKMADVGHQPASKRAKDNRNRQRSGEESSDKAIVEVASAICSGPP